MYRKPVIGPPWVGWNDSAPYISLPSNSFRQITNWLINKGRLNAAPAFSNVILPGATTFWGIRTFTDATGAIHTVGLSASKAYYYLGGSSWSAAIGSWTPNATQPYAIEVYQNQMFFSAGPQKLRLIAGDASAPFAGDVPGGCAFLGKLGGQLLMINTYENQLNFPRRVRWCAQNNALEWDPSQDFTAGAVDLSDVEDALTGWATITPNGYAFRNNGITAFSPTGIGSRPYTIENFSTGPSGIGCFYPYSLANYGTFAVFAANDDIYLFTGAAPQPIGGNVKKSLFVDLDNASNSICSVIIGKLGVGVDYLTYWLSIPLAGDTKSSVWVYHFDDQTWINDQLPYGAVRSMGIIATS